MIKSVDATSITLQPGKTQPDSPTFTLAKNARVYLDDGSGDKLGFTDGKLSDLCEGAHVTLRLDQKEVVRIWVEGPSVQGVLKAVDADKNTLTATVSMSKTEPATDMTFNLIKNVRLFIDDGSTKDKTKPIKSPTLADLPVNALVTLRLSADRKVVGNIRAEGQSVGGVVKAVDAAKSSITVAISVNKGEPAVDKAFAVDKNASISIADGKSNDKSADKKNGKLGDVPVGAMVKLRLSLDQQVVVAMHVDGVSVHGGVAAVDPAKNTITLSQKVDGDKTFNVVENAVIHVDGMPDAKKLADVPIGASAIVHLLPDQSAVREVRAFGPSMNGIVRGQAGPDSITLENKEGQSTYTLVKDVPITIDDKGRGKLADVIDGSDATLRLSADRSVVLDIHVRGPRFHGRVKAIDADKGVITLHVGGKNGVGGEDKNFKTSKDTVVLVGSTGERIKLSDARLADKDVVLQLAIDQKAASRIATQGD